MRTKTLEFSLENIGEILDFCERGEARCRYVADLIQLKIAKVDDKIAALRRLRSVLAVINWSTATAIVVYILGRICMNL